MKVSLAGLLSRAASTLRMHGEGGYGYWQMEMGDDLLPLLGMFHAAKEPQQATQS